MSTTKNVKCYLILSLLKTMSNPCNAPWRLLKSVLFTGKPVLCREPLITSQSLQLIVYNGSQTVRVEYG